MLVNTRSVNLTVAPSEVIAWFEMRSPGVALSVTRTRIVTVAGALARALTVQVTLFPLTLQLPLLALGDPSIASIGLMSSSMVIERLVVLELNTEIE